MPSACSRPSGCPSPPPTCPETIEKITAEHQVYGPVLMLKQDANGRFMTVRWFEKTGRCEEDQVFRVENLSGY